MNIYEKINAIMAAVESLQKDGKIAYGNTKYNYLSEAKTTAEMRKQLVAHKLVLLPTLATENKDGQVTHGTYTYRLINAEAPEEYIDLMVCGQGHDSADKGSGKASSYAYKYLLWRTFAIPSNDDPDQVSSDEINDTVKLVGATEIKALKKQLDRTGVRLEQVLHEYGIADVAQMKWEDWRNATARLDKVPDKVELDLS